jgi:hypothetical protein
MSSPGNGESVPFAVRMSAQTRATLFSLHQRALEAGTGQQFVAAFARIMERLRSDPGTFGEPIYRLPALQLMVRQAVALPLLVDFAVREVQPLVFIRGFKVLSRYLCTTPGCWTCGGGAAANSPSPSTRRRSRRAWWS